MDLKQLSYNTLRNTEILENEIQFCDLQSDHVPRLADIKNIYKQFQSVQQEKIKAI